MTGPTTVIVTTLAELQAMIRSELKAAIAELRPAEPAAADCEVLDYPQSVAYLQLSESTMRRAVKAGDIKPCRVGRAVRFMKSELDQFLERQKQGFSEGAAVGESAG